VVGEPCSRNDQNIPITYISTYGKSSLLQSPPPFPFSISIRTCKPTNMLSYQMYYVSVHVLAHPKSSTLDVMFSALAVEAGSPTLCRDHVDDSRSCAQSTSALIRTSPVHNTCLRCIKPVCNGKNDRRHALSRGSGWGIWRNHGCTNIHVATRARRWPIISIRHDTFL
jgi:hypothetical protein